MGNEESTLETPNEPPLTLRDRTLDALADYIKDGKASRIVVMTGAGISTAAGIPDFRSPGTGLYDNLARLDLPYAEAVFDIDYFQKHPEPFYYLAKELYPGKFHPTISHAFIALLAQKRLLLMNFSQNIDCLERRAGVPAEKIIEAHGSFATQRCVQCRTAFPDEQMLDHVHREVVPRCLDKSCNGLVKPDIVFFGEPLPPAFKDSEHLPGMADLAIIIGTSLTVYPFAGLPEYVQPGTPRLLLNKERVGRVGHRPDDVVEVGECDVGVRKLASLLGWSEELEALWHGIVGEKEVARQTARVGLDAGETDVEEEIRRLTEEVERALSLETAKDGEGDDGAKKQEEVQAPEAEITLREDDVRAGQEDQRRDSDAASPEKNNDLNAKHRQLDDSVAMKPEAKEAAGADRSQTEAAKGLSNG